MIEQVFKWCADNALLCTTIGMGLGILLGASKNRIKMFGFTLSQWIRRLFGEKLEKAVEDAVDSISEGMKSDNKK